MDSQKIPGRTFDEVYNDYSDMLYRLALSHLGKKEDAEDVIHDVFIKYCDSEPSFSDIGHEKAWFIRVTVNKCRDLFRRKAIRRYIPLWELDEKEPEIHDDNSGIFECISLLDEKYRAPVVLHYLEGYSVEETAQLLGLSLSAAKMRLSRARDAIKKNM